MSRRIGWHVHGSLAHRDRGSATIWVLCGAGLVLVVAYAVVLLAAVTEARQRAVAAADLAALAAASTSTRDPCTVAARSAAANHAELIGCSLSGGDVVVRAAVALPAALVVFGARTVAVSARAGPQ